MLPPRPSWPAEETATLLVFVGSKFGAGALPGTRKASSRKLRPFRGRFSIAAAEMTPSTAELVAAMGGAAASTVTASCRAPTSSVTSSVEAAAHLQRDALEACAAAKPVGLHASPRRSPGGRLVTR